MVGQYFQGGKIAYIYQPGEMGFVPGEAHGLISSIDEIGLYTWGCVNNNVTGSEESALGLGLNNTIDIHNAGCGVASEMCFNLNKNGYSDWHLPSIDELNILYLQKEVLGYNVGWYWSSTEGGANNVSCIYFPSGDVANFGFQKSEFYYVRAVRYF